MSGSKPLLLLFDGHALIHRGFHALPGLSNKKGQPTGAVYGFASMLLKTLSDLKPEYCAVAFDSASPTFRHTEFEAYKAHRPKTPDELISQFALVRNLVKAFEIPLFEIDGFEADDILGALSKQAMQKGIDTIIVTGDTDMLQIVNETVRVMLPKPKRPFSDTRIYDEQAVIERYHLKPRQLTDLKGLKGDPSDNIPGVPGIGEKTAQKLLEQFGCIEEIYERIEEVNPPKVREKLQINEAAARQSKWLATIVDDIPLKLELPVCCVGDYNSQKVTEIFQELGFFSLLEKLPRQSAGEQTVSAPQPPNEGPVSYKTIHTLQDLNELISEMADSKIIAFDTETTSTNAREARLVGISLSNGNGRAWYLPVGHLVLEPQLPLPEVISKLKPILENARPQKTAHNAKYDQTVLSNHGIDVKSLDFDTMIAAHLLGEKALGLKQLAFSRLGVAMTPITDLIGKGAKQISMANVSIEHASPYACADADITFRLNAIFENELKQENLWKLFTEVEMPLLAILQKMESDGIALNARLLGEMSETITSEIGRIEAAIYDTVGHEFNINSSQQLGKVLFDELRLPSARKTKSGYSTDMSVLEGLGDIHPVVKQIVDYRQLAKLKSTYVDALPALVDPKEGRIHTSFNQTATATGRLSSSDPNLQNIPVRTEIGKKIRQAFISPDENSVLLSADYSQIELRVMAHLSRDPGLLAAFIDDEDIHTTTAATVFGVKNYEVDAEMRRIAKVVNFGVIYGMSDYGLQQATELSRQQASDFIKAYFEKYKGITEYISRTKKQASEKGYVKTLLGRKRYIPEINSSNYQVRQAAERMAINMPVQGTAADIIKLAMIKIAAAMSAGNLKSKMVLQVHDELIFEIPKNELEPMRQMIRTIMPQAMEFSVPLKIDIKSGSNWGQMRAEN